MKANGNLLPHNNWHDPFPSLAGLLPQPGFFFVHSQVT